MKEFAPDLQWKAIQNMTTEEVMEVLQQAKIYIDFGNHPGKDRIPREAAMSGCIVITGRHGSAAFSKDVSVPEEYKIEQNDEFENKAVGIIRNSLNHYDEMIVTFNEYRQKILDEKEEFLDDIKKIFFDRFH